MTPREFDYDAVGATEPQAAVWTRFPPGFRRFERTVVIGRGDYTWAFASGEVLSWGIKRRSGFRVCPPGPAVEGGDCEITIGVGRLVVREPVRVVAVVDDEHRRALAYGTLPGHPVAGEEAFIVHRTDDGTVLLTLRSLTRAAPSGPWRALFPALLLAQRAIRLRYLRVLRT